MPHPVHVTDSDGPRSDGPRVTGREDGGAFRQVLRWISSAVESERVSSLLRRSSEWSETGRLQPDIRHTPQRIQTAAEHLSRWRRQRFTTSIVYYSLCVLL